MLAAHQIAVLALPAEPRRCRQRLFHHRRGINEHLDFGPRCFGDQPARHPLQRPFDDVMIVAALRIDRDAPAVGVIGERQRIVRGRVAHPQRDHRSHLGPQPLRRSALRGAVFHPDHVAVAALGEPLFQSLGGLRRRAGIGDPERDKAMRARHRLQAVFQRRRFVRQGFGNHCRSIREPSVRAIACG